MELVVNATPRPLYSQESIHYQLSVPIFEGYGIYHFYHYSILHLKSLNMLLCFNVCEINIFFSLTQQPNANQDRLILEVSTSHTIAQRSR